MSENGDRPQVQKPNPGQAVIRLGNSQEIDVNAFKALGGQVAASGAFGNITAGQAVSLMLVAHAHGIHPMIAVQRFHMIEGKAGMRPEFMAANFLARGGQIEIVCRCGHAASQHEDIDACRIRSCACESYDPENDGASCHVLFRFEGRSPVKVRLTRAQFDESGLTTTSKGVKKNWAMWPAEMLWWRCMARGIRQIDPASLHGFYLGEELADGAATERVRVDEIRQEDPLGFAPATTTAEAVPGVEAEYTEDQSENPYGDAEPAESAADLYAACEELGMGHEEIMDLMPSYPELTPEDTSRVRARLSSASVKSKLGIGAP